MKLSVIIPTRNRSAVLRRSLESLCQQTLFEEMFDIWVIDNGSTDNTALMCEEFCTKLPNLKYHLEPIPGLHSGRHAGLMLSSSDILVFADDDIRAFPTWLEGIAETFNNPKVALVGGKNLPDYVHTPPQWLDDLWRYNEYGRCLGYLALLDFGDVVRSIPPTYIWGCNFAIQRSILIECGGFHPDGMPNEMIRYRGDGETAVSRYVQKKGYLSIYNPKASVY
ncbi:MAG: glycosyltransferase family 2 protein, partial [Thermodesulfobacteriota bacterium]|nr:glycosyltransferase family 2 protein [Thermodesulfobacteriota bacterium]